MKTTTKKLLTIFISVVLLLAAGGLVAGLLVHKKLGEAGSSTIAFYRVPVNVQNAMLEVLNSELEQAAGNHKKPFEAVLLNDQLSLEEQKETLKACGAVIFVNDLETAQFFEGPVAKSIELSVAEGYPSSILSSIKLEGAGAAEAAGKPSAVAGKTSKSGASATVKILPFLYDFYELDVNYPLYKKSGMKSLDVWIDLAETGYRELAFTKAPVILPAADDRELLNIMGLIAEAHSGYEAYDKMLEDFDLETALAYGNPLAQAVGEVKGLLQHGIIPYDSLKFTADDVLFYLDYQLAGITFTKLSQHRKITNKVVNNYTSIYCPSKVFTSDRKFAADQYSISLIKKNKTTELLLKNLTDSLQTQLATKTGLAPVQKNCAVPDHQADDVRFWLAASKGPVMPLANFFRTEEELHAAANRVRELLR